MLNRSRSGYISSAIIFLDTSRRDAYRADTIGDSDWTKSSLIELLETMFSIILNMLLSGRIVPSSVRKPWLFHKARDSMVDLIFSEGQNTAALLILSWANWLHAASSASKWQLSRLLIARGFSNAMLREEGRLEEELQSWMGHESFAKMQIVSFISS